MIFRGIVRLMHACVSAERGLFVLGRKYVYTFLY